MDISSVNNGSAAGDASGANAAGWRTRMEQAMGPVAQLFGTTSDQLMDAVRESGGSLADYAASKGISSTDLVSAIEKGLQDAPNGGQLSDTQLANLANRIANHKPGGHHHHHNGGASAVGNTDPTTDPTTATPSVQTELEQLVADLQSPSVQGMPPADAATASGTGNDELSDIVNRLNVQL